MKYLTHNTKLPELISIQIQDVTSSPLQGNLPEEYGSSILKTIYTTSGNYDLLLTAEGEPIQERSELVNSIEKFFNKSFQVATIDNEKCLLHKLN